MKAMRLIGFLIAILVSTGCINSGIRMGAVEGGDGGDSGEIGTEGGFGGGVTAPGVSSLSPAGTSGSAIVSTETLTVLIRTGTTSFRGGIAGDNVQILDPFLQSGINEVFSRTSK